MTLNLEKVGQPVAQIVGGEMNGKIIYINTDEDADNLIKKPIKNMIQLKNGRLQPIRDTTKEREVLYIFGASGSGKSTYVKNYIKAQRKLEKKKIPVYLFSYLDEDESLDEIEPMRIRLDDSLLENPISLDEFEEGSIIIYDDVDCIPNKPLRQYLIALANEILQVGRHYKLNIIFTSHLPTLKNESRIILAECHHIVYFPKCGGNGRQTNYLLKEYLGLDKKIISMLKNSKSRWADISTRYPNYCMNDRMIKILNNDEDESD